MFNYLIDKFPDSYKGYKLNTSFRVALKIQELLDDPTIISGEVTDKWAAYLVALSLLVQDYEQFIRDEKLGLAGAFELISWWLSCGNNDKVEEYWKQSGIMPDVDDIKFDIADYKKAKSDMIRVETIQGDGSVKAEEVSKTAIIEFTAPDGSTRYKKETRGDPASISIYEDSSKIYSAFYAKYHIDLGEVDLHWFKFCSLLAEIESTEGTIMSEIIKIRNFNPDEYKGKGYESYRTKMLKARDNVRVLGILPYNRRKEW